MRLLFAGTPEVAVPALRLLLSQSAHEVVGVLTRPPARSGRGRQLHSSPVAAVAREAGVLVLEPPGPSDPALIDAVRALDVDCAPVVAYGALLRQPALDLPRVGWVNLHFSILPAWRGAAPVQHAILHGDDVTGASTFLIGPGLDDGPVYGVVTEPVRPRDTSGDLLERLATSGAHLLLATLDGIADGSVQARDQGADGVSLAPKLTADDARIRFDVPAVAVDRRVRACTPAPGAWVQFRGERLKVGPVELAPGQDELSPGAIVLSPSGVLVGTSTDPVRLVQVQPAGKTMMAAGDWARGARLASDEKFE